METLIKALGPAFAAGFAVQRLLEILDSLLKGRINEDNKKGWLMGIALFFGLIIAYMAKLRVLAPLGADLSGLGESAAYGIDYVVTALIISAGTEGFNSILKFLSYKKEEKKAEAVQEKASALGTLARTEARALGAKRANLEHMLDASADEFQSVSERLEDALKSEIISRWEEKFIEDGWKDRAFGEYSNNLDAHKEAVHDATKKVATALGTTVPDGIMVNLQKKVGADTTPGGILPHMRIAIG